MKKYLIISTLVFLMLFSILNTTQAEETNIANNIIITKPLLLGSKGGEVTILQNWLIKNGYLLIKIPTGYYGTKTKQAVIDLQKANNLKIDGKVGPQIRNFLKTFKELKKDQVLSDCTSSTKPYIKVLSPNGGEVFKGGEKIPIKWRMCNSKGDEKIFIYLVYTKDFNKIGGWKKTLIHGPDYFTSNDGEELVTLLTEDEILSSSSNGSLFGTGRHFRIEVLADRSPECINEPCTVLENRDLSDDYFSIGSEKVVPVADPNVSITLLSPNGGEKYKPGDTIKVEWLSKNIPDDANIAIIFAGQKDKIATKGIKGTINDGNELIKLPDAVDFLPQSDNLHWAYGNNFKIGLFYHSYDVIYYSDYSDNFFSIEN